MTHRTRVIPKRQWDEDFHEFTNNPDDPRYDDRTASEIYDEEVHVAKFAAEMRAARRKQQQEKA
jgi:hypothetical protein